MVKLTKIYTKTGDAGTTKLATGDELPKHHIRVEAYGAVDEANAAIGLVRAALGFDGYERVLNADLTRIQNDLFDVGADLSTPGPDDALKFTPLRMVKGPIDWLETRIDALNNELKPLESFILPAGSEIAARLHMARTITRRAERQVCRLLSEHADAVNPLAQIYLNRLSDYLFVASRWIDRGKGDELWTPGENR